MKRALLLLLLVARPAHAEDDAVTTASRWVGTWSGKVTAKGCTDAKKKVSLDVALTREGRLRSNGDLLVDGFGDLDWQSDGKGLAIAREGMKATLVVSGKKVKLALETDGGCKIKGTLTRASSGIAACDTTRALATIKSQCESLPSETRGESLTTVDADWKKWSKLKGKKKKAQALACAEQTTTLQAEVSSCVTGGFASTGLVECDAYIRAVEAYMRCDKVPQQARDGAKQGIEYMLQGWGDLTQMPEEAKQATNDACKQGVDALKQGATAMGCPL
jgi:hypothetical protein